MFDLEVQADAEAEFHESRETDRLASRLAGERRAANDQHRSVA